MRVSQWGKSRSYRQTITKRVIREMEERGQVFVLGVFLLLLALSSPEQALSWLLGGVSALLSFHAAASSIRRAERMEPDKNRMYRRRAFRRRVMGLAIVLFIGYLVSSIELATVVTAVFTTKLALNYLAPPRTDWRSHAVT